MCDNFPLVSDCDLGPHSPATPAPDSPLLLVQEGRPLWTVLSIYTDVKKNPLLLLIFLTNVRTEWSYCFLISKTVNNVSPLCNVSCTLCDNKGAHVIYCCMHATLTEVQDQEGWLFICGILMAGGGRCVMGGHGVWHGVVTQTGHGWQLCVIWLTILPLAIPHKAPGKP